MVHSQVQPGPLVVVVGETGSGKSALAMELARRLNGEIICADSWTVYKGFDIGTAKPSREDREVVPHHLLDIADPGEGYSAALFKEQTSSLIEDILQRGRLPILVGGSGLYIDSILYSYSFLDSADLSERAKLNTMELPELLGYAEELGLDMNGIDIRNKRRIVRHIENRGARPYRKPLRSNTCVIGLLVPRDELEGRIERRVDTMLAAGLEDEVRQLSKSYGWDVEPMKGIGYREWKDYFHAGKTLAETRQAIVHDSLQLAKKQRTWFRRNNSIHWLSDPSEAVDIVTTHLNK